MVKLLSLMYVGSDHHLCGYYTVLYGCGQVVRFDDCHTCGCMFDWWSVVGFDVVVCLIYSQVVYICHHYTSCYVFDLSSNCLI